MQASIFKENILTNFELFSSVSSSEYNTKRIGVCYLHTHTHLSMCRYSKKINVVVNIVVPLELCWNVFKIRNWVCFEKQKLVK